MQRLNLTPTSYHSLPFDVSRLPDVAAAGYVSASVLSKSRDVVRFLAGGFEKKTSCMSWGSLVDALWTQPDTFKDDYVVLPDDAPADLRRFSDAKKPSQGTLESIAWWNGFEARNDGKEVVKEAEHKQVLQAVSMLNQHAVARDLLENSATQVALVGESPFIPGTRAKCLIDLLPDGDGIWGDAVVDLKTTNDIDDHALVNTAFKFDYLVKLGYYALLVEAAGLGVRDRFVIIWQSSSFPYEVKVRQFRKEEALVGKLVAGRRVLALTQMSAMRISRHYDLEVNEMHVPEWQLNLLLK